MFIVQFFYSFSWYIYRIQFSRVFNEILWWTKEQERVHVSNTMIYACHSTDIQSLLFFFMHVCMPVCMDCVLLYKHERQ